MTRRACHEGEEVDPNEFDNFCRERSLVSAKSSRVSLTQMIANHRWLVSVVRGAFQNIDQCMPNSHQVASQGYHPIQWGSWERARTTRHCGASRGLRPKFELALQKLRPRFSDRKWRTNHKNSVGHGIQHQTFFLKKRALKWLSSQSQSRPDLAAQTSLSQHNQFHHQRSRISEWRRAKQHKELIP